jgi:hypothetical protein
LSALTSPDDDRTMAGEPAIGADETAAGAAAPVDPEATQLGTSAFDDPDVTRAGTAELDDPDATRIGAAGFDDPDATRNGSAGLDEPEATRPAHRRRVPHHVGGHGRDVPQPPPERGEAFGPAITSSRNSASAAWAPSTRRGMPNSASRSRSS